MAVASPVQVDAPTIVPQVGGLLAVADVTESSDPHIGFGMEWFSYVCGPAGIAPGMCVVADGVVVDEEKVFEGGYTVQAPPFAVYAGVVCDLLGRPYDAQVRARLAGHEDALVAKAFYEAVLVGQDTGQARVQVLTEEVTWDNIVDVIGELEQFAGETYPGRPVLHMNRHTATWAIACDVVRPDLDGTLYTLQGTPVANSAGYPDGLVFITGGVRVWRTGVEVHDADDLSFNQSYALAERMYAVGTDCLLAYAGLDPAAPPPTITAVTPAMGTVAGGTTVTITGTGFEA